MSWVLGSAQSSRFLGATEKTRLHAAACGDRKGIQQRVNPRLARGPGCLPIHVSSLDHQPVWRTSRVFSENSMGCSLLSLVVMLGLSQTHQIQEHQTNELRTLMVEHALHCIKIRYYIMYVMDYV